MRDCCKSEKSRRHCKRKDGKILGLAIRQCEEYIKSLGLTRDFIHFKSELEDAE